MRGWRRRVDGEVWLAPMPRSQRRDLKNLISDGKSMVEIADEGCASDGEIWLGVREATCWSEIVARTIGVRLVQVFISLTHSHRLITPEGDRLL